MADPQTSQTDPLAGLIDIPLPQEASLWPQTWTLRIAIALIVASALVAAWRLAHRFYANRYRREALAELDAMMASGAPDQARLSVLVRRTALGAFRREAVAPLTGSAWLAFLDRSYGGREFSEGAGRLLISAPYQRAPVSRDQLEALADLVRRWIRGHHV
ncbi:DUF4381 domain-containing protein [Bradyrhizobium sp.]|uniref:DUF4381 domain-containing protein n=1 Tax=Bradyrhizobium sp. TaxID=376 RepID=UPI002BB33D0B|nr:DUF4381 domain-containing protein [Bradyrhizobium sp.]HMM91806.1 DUF4381 domain-containing protein [Bradyrhizobium sp.]